jgi:hypothetical protein
LFTPRAGVTVMDEGPVAGELLIPIDGYIEAQEAWHKMKKHAAAKKAKKKGAPHPEWDGVFKANLTNVPGYAYAVAHHGRLVAEGAVGSARTSLNAPATPWTTSTPASTWQACRSASPPWLC